MVLTHEYWMKRFGGDCSIVGKQVRLDGKSVTVIGVLQPAPSFPQRMDALLNMVISEHHTSAMMVQGRTHRMTEMIARLAPGATVEQARTEVATIRTRVQAEHQGRVRSGSGYRVTVIPFQEVLGERARLTLWLLMGAAAFVMIISAANVANLTLMRGVRREHELVVRAALGAGTRRLRRLLLVENLVLAFAGRRARPGDRDRRRQAAHLARRALLAARQRDPARRHGARLHAGAVARRRAAALVRSHARQGGHARRWIASGANRMSGSLRRQRLQRGLVVAQIAVSVVLLAGAGLLTRTMLQLSEVDTGLKTEEVLTMEVPHRLRRHAATPTRKHCTNGCGARSAPSRACARSASAPSMPLRSVAVPARGQGRGQPLAGGEAMPRAEFRTANPEYFRAAGIPLLKGREFSSTDRDSSARVVIINKTLADRLFPDRDPIGQRIAWTGDVLRFIGISGDWRTVVGVVGNTKDGGLDAAPRGVVFQPFAQEALFAGGLVIRADRNATALAPAATRIVRSIAPTDPIENVLTVAQIKDQSVAPRRLNAVLVSSFGMLAVIIAAVGIAGVLAFSVSARTNEIGIRMSLGADSGRVQRMILREGGVLLVVGLVLGVGGAFLADARHPRTAVRRRAARSGHARRRRADDGGDRHRGVLAAGAARGADRSGGGDSAAVAPRSPDV